MYNYLDAVKQDVIDYIKDNDILADGLDRDELEEKLNDDLWVEDSVTGNGSGSYTFDRAKAKVYLMNGDGFDHLSDAISDFDIDAKTLGEKLKDQDWEWFDVTIRCYLLGQAIGLALDELNVE